MSFRRRLLFAILAFSTSSACLAREDLFPPMAFYPKSEFDNDMSDEHMTVQLRALEEPSLWKASQKDATARAYRFLWLASFRHPICVRVVREGDAVWMRVSRHDGGPGVVAGKLNMDRIESLSLKQWERLDELVGKSKFWTAPASVQESRGIADGDGLLIEGIRGGSYHVIDRAGSAAGESYKSVCRSMLELAGGDVVPEWDRRRKDERGSPNYRAEPAETADSGVPDYLVEPFFRMEDFYPKNWERDKEESDDKAQRLWSLKQRSLWHPLQNDGAAEAYRLWWWTEDGDSVCVRMVKPRETTSLHLVQLDPETGVVIVDVDLELTPKHWASLDALVEKSKFWTAPAEVRPAAERARADGVFVEGVQNGRFHVVERGADVMDWRLKDLCRLMLELAESKALPIWDQWRERERDDPNYHFEPPQVPDLYGVPLPDDTAK